MRIAVIGSGIAGLGAALALSEENDVTLFEKEPRFGGHSNTVDVPYGDLSQPVDTGFIVYNERNYPNLCGLFGHLGVATERSDMSFGFSLGRGDLEWAGESLDTVFAQRANILRPRFLRGVLDIPRFNRLARQRLEDGSLAGLGLGEWLGRERFSPWLRDCYVLPMAGAIWSAPVKAMINFPAENFCVFFDNHDLLGGLAERQRWRTVSGGSRHYVDAIVSRLGGRATAGVGAVSITRKGGLPRLRFSDGSEQVFDQVVLACHAPQALALLRDADSQERATLGAFHTCPNRAVLHSDPTLMPLRRKVWSSWNFLSGGPEADREGPAPVTYWMNRLQNIDPSRPLFLSLNPRREPAPETVHEEFAYAHPVTDARAFSARKGMDAIQGRGGVWHAGAWLGYGFHEDGLRSGLEVAAALGARPVWARDVADTQFGALAEAAE